MFVDAHQVPHGTNFDADLCIIGAGAAGITIARELMGLNAKVLVLEFGGYEFDPATQDLYRGRNVGMPYYDLDAARLRYLGGTTNHWAGWCHPLMDSDFEPKPWIPGSGWPIGNAELAPYFARTCPIVEVPEKKFDIAFWESSLAATKQPMRKLPVSAARFQTSVFQLSPPTRFGELYRDPLAKAQNVQVLINANLTEIVTDTSGNTVTTLKVATLKNRHFTVKPKFVVLACGAIENARLLLLSRGTERDGVGNRNGLVGRYFADHLEQASGYAFLAQPDDAYDWYFKGSSNTRAALQLSLEKQREYKVLGSMTTFHEVSDTSETSEGFGALRRLMHAGWRRGISKSLLSDLASVVVDINQIAGLAYNKVRNAPPRDDVFLMMNRIEIRPNRDSRVMLDTERDPLGLNRVKLDWQLTEADKMSIYAAEVELSRAFGESGLGRIKMDFRPDRPWPATMQGGYHHMCTTRMSNDPKHGVVDSNCRVHGMSNLWVGGSSVFASTGTVNPTFTIVALALRLADHLKGKLA